MTDEPQRKLIVGSGYLGSRVARRWREAGHEVHIVTRSSARAEAWRRDGYHAHVADVTRPDSLAELPAVETLLYAVGHDKTTGDEIETVYAGGLANVLAALEATAADALERIIYISTTGVYGDAVGEWVDEDTPPAPHRPGGKASLAAEEVLRAHWLAASGIVLRMAGLYGPGRVPNLQALVQGEPIAVAASGWLNLIHVEDAATVVEAVDAEVTPPRLYVVSDGHPVPRREYYEYAAQLLGAPSPKFVEPPADAPSAARAAANKRISNRRLMADTTPALQYPTYREGLAASLSKTEN